MVEAMDVLNAFGTPLKLAWVAWLAWGVGQYFWLRHERSMPMKRATSVAAPTAKKPSAPRREAAPAAHARVVERLVTPTHVAPHAKPAAPSTPVTPLAESQPEPAAPGVPMGVFDGPSTPSFDPATAVIEQFGAFNDNALDKFVRDFDMQEARPQRRRPPVPDAGSYGVEAPSAP